MRILILIPQLCHLGGAESLDLQLARQLNKRGIRAAIVGMYAYSLAESQRTRAALLRTGIPQVEYLHMPVHPAPGAVMQGIAKLRKVLKKGNCDIVHTSMVAPATLASWAVRGTRARHVAGIHHVFRKELHRALAYRVWRYSLRANRRTRYYAISDYVAQSWIRYSRTPPRLVRTIYNAVSEDFFDPVPDRQGVRSEFALPEHTRIALYVGRLAAYKGIDTALYALGPVLDSLDLHLFFVGNSDLNVKGTATVLDSMKATAISAGWTHRVRYLGHRCDVARLMAAADILVHPTRTEGFGLVLAQALAVGLPVVASNVEGIPEVLRNTGCILVPPDDPPALRNAVSRILQRTGDEVAAARNLAQSRAQDFRMDRRVKEMVALFNDVND